MTEQPSQASPPGDYAATAREPIAAILDALRRAGRVLLCGHLRADGDCIGSMAAMHAFLRGQGKACQLYFRGPVQDVFLAFAPEGEAPDGEFPADFGADVTLCLDCGSADRIHPDFARLAQGTVIDLDHHGDNTRFGAINWVEPAAAATAEMVTLLLEAAGEMAWTPAIAIALYLGLAADTGGFRYANTTATTLECAGRLVRRGAGPSAIARVIWGNRPIETIQLQAAVLAGLHFELDGRFVWGEITRDLFARFGGEANEPDNLSGELRAIRGVEVALLLRESGDGMTRASMRSGDRIDVSVIAGRLGGGGHRRAAGAELRAPYPEARDRIVAEAVQAVSEQLKG